MRSPQSDSSLGVLEEVRRLLGVGSHADDDAPRDPLVDGRYEGGNQELFVELRIDFEGNNVISADFFRVGLTGRTFSCSLRTTPGSTVSPTEREWPILGIVGNNDMPVTGSLSLDPQEGDPAAVAGHLQIDSALGGLPVGRRILFTAERVSAAMRRIGLEIERESGVDELPTFEHNGVDVSVTSAFLDAGVEVFNSGGASTIPNPPTGGWGTAQLHALMTEFAQAELNRAEWQLQLLLLDRSTRSGLFGIMFDSTAQLPRQGAAVFSGEISARTTGAHTARKIIQTTLHELGHACNLAHRFERSVGHADSTSIMNYDWRYRGGDNRAEFWSRFDFQFDPDELEFLRHGPRPFVIPGGDPFHSVNYWADGNGNYSPYDPEVPLDILSLELHAPDAGPVFRFGQPVFLEVELTNTSSDTLTLHPEWLDPKTGFLDVQIRRVDTGDDRDFHPVVERCFDLDQNAGDAVPSGQSVTNNINLTYGTSGFPFMEPGGYEVTAFLALPRRIQGQDVELVVRSEPLRLRVSHPQTLDEESDALTLFRDDVGLFFALGGSRVLPDAREDLKSLVERRQGKKKSITDPIVASVQRCLGIDAGRPYVRFENGSFETTQGDSSAAVTLLQDLKGAALKFFDSHTATATQSLRRKHAARADKT